jgi:hypothetical protein
LYLTGDRLFALGDQTADDQSGLSGCDVAVVVTATIGSNPVSETKFFGDFVFDLIRDYTPAASHSLTSRLYSSLLFLDYNLAGQNHHA